MRVFILLFNARTENEGIHSIREGDRNKVLMFESEDDATRFALMLEAQDFPTPTVEAIDAEEVKQFCASCGYDWEVVPTQGELVIPPEINVEETDWQPDPQVKEKSEDSNTKQESPELSDTELEKMRRKFEGLL